jgi:hypothetical protein
LSEVFAAGNTDARLVVVMPAQALAAVWGVIAAALPPQPARAAIAAQRGRHAVFGWIWSFKCVS